MWQASIATTADGEEAVAFLLERIFQKAASIYCNEATGLRTVAVYPEKIPGTPLAVKKTLAAGLIALRDCGLEIAPGKIEIKKLRPENWAESWKRHFKPIEIGDHLLVKPPWSKRKPRRGQKVIILNPGLSFGTGQHPTTLFCLQQLAKCRAVGKSQSFLDIGTGSGILAIAAAKLGYSPVDAFDFDPVAVRISRQNVQKNRVQNKVHPMKKDLTRMRGKLSKRYDVICANLVCDLLINEASTICDQLKPGGSLIVAGILTRQFDSLQKNLHRFGLTLGLSIADKEWRSGQFVLSNAT